MLHDKNIATMLECAAVICRSSNIIFRISFISCSKQCKHSLIVMVFTIWTKSYRHVFTFSGWLSLYKLLLLNLMFEQKAWKSITLSESVLHQSRTTALHLIHGHTYHHMLFFFFSLFFFSLLLSLSIEVRKFIC